MAIGTRVCKLLTKKLPEIEEKNKTPNSKLSKEPNFKINRGGDGILDYDYTSMAECLKDGTIHGVKDESLEKMILWILEKEHIVKPIVVSVPVALLAFILSDNVPNLLIRAGLTTTAVSLITTARTNALLVSTGLLSGGLAAYAGALPWLGIFGSSLTVALLALILRGTFINCNQLFYELPQVNGKPYIEHIQTEQKKVFIKSGTDNEVQLLIAPPESLKNIGCKYETLEETPNLVKMKKVCPSPESVEVYKPFTERTHDLNDVLHGDETANFKKLAPYLEKYYKMEEKPLLTGAERFTKRRTEFNKNRNKNRKKDPVVPNLLY